MESGFAIISDGARNWSIYTKLFQRDIGAMRTSCKRAIEVVSSERTYKVTMQCGLLQHGAGVPWSQHKRGEVVVRTPLT